MLNLQSILEMLGISFVPETHKYFKDNKEIPSANQIIDKVMGNVFTKNTLQMIRARDKGTLIHNAISDFVKFGIEPSFPMDEFDNFLKFSNKHNIVWALSEQIIYNSIDGMPYCGTLDLYSLSSSEISDIKTGSTKQLKKWQIQLSLYAGALRDTFGLKVSKGSILWLHNDKAEYIEIELLSKETILDVLMKYYEKGMDIQQEELSLECLNSNAIRELDETLTAIEVMENKVKEIKEKIKLEMEQRNINQIKIGKRVISYVAPTEREIIDSKKLREEYPQIWDSCKKTSKTSGSIRIK